MITGPQVANLILIAFGCIALWVCFEAHKGIKRSENERMQKRKKHKSKK